MTNDEPGLRIKRHDAADGAQTYLYVIPGVGSFTETTSRQERSALESGLVDAATELRHELMSGEVDSGAGESCFAELGQLMSDRYVPEPVLDHVFGATTPLVIETDDPEFPWELVRRQGKPLGIHRPVARTLPQRKRFAPGIERWGTRRHALLVGDPSGTLPSAPAEIGEMAAWMGAYREPQTGQAAPYGVGRPLLGPLATLATLTRLLREGCEFFHYTGHVTYDEHHHGLSGLPCVGGILTADDLRGLVTSQGTFAFVFVNGCMGARAAQTSDPALRSLAVSGVVVNGLAAAFLAGGASAFISTLWPVEAENARAFARAFYEQARRGVSFGEALRWVRARWRELSPDNPTWAAYVLYGNPWLTLDSVRDPVRLGPEAERAPEPAHVSVVVSPVEIPADATFLSPRVETFFRRLVPDGDLGLSDRAQAALQQTLDWVDLMRWHQVSRLDLLVGLALVPGGMVERGLRAVGSSPRTLCTLDTVLFGRGPRRAEQPDVSEGVARALDRAARFARAAGRAEVAEDDLVAGLLDLAGTGTLRLAMRVVGCSPRVLLAAARGQGSPARTEVRPAPVSQVLSDVVGSGEAEDAKRDETTRRLLRDLRAEVRAELRGAGAPPCLGREHELHEALRVLTRPGDAHVVLRGPAGVGVRALAHHLAVRLVDAPGADVAALAGWDLFAVRIDVESPKVGEWLRAQLGQLGPHNVLVFEDLPRLLAGEGIPAFVEAALRHPNVRCLATSRYDEFQAVLQGHPEIARAFTPIDLVPPTPEAARAMVAAHVPLLQRRYQVTIAPGAVDAAVGAWRRELPLVLPGAAIARLRAACAWGFAREAEAGLPFGAPPAPDELETAEAASVPLVTSDDVRDAPSAVES